MDPKGKSDMVSEEVRMFKEEQRKASAVTQTKQWAWTKWNDIEPIKLSWKSLIAMEPLAISFLLCSTYDLLPNATNLKLWGYTNSDLCLSCKSDRGTLHHVLSACPHSLQMYTWRHNNTLSGGKRCLVMPGLAVPPWATETVLSPLDGGWWGHGIARAFTRCMMKKKFNAKSSLYIYIKYIRCCLVLFYGISTIVDGLMPNPFYTYILNIYNLVWYGLVWFYGVSTIVAYLIPNPLYTYISNM